jgi:hypothetical protein
VDGAGVGRVGGAGVRGCTWVRGCGESETSAVWRETRPGLVVHENVCGEHLPRARERGYREDEPPVPPPEAAGPWWPVPGGLA